MTLDVNSPVVVDSVRGVVVQMLVVATLSVALMLAGCAVKPPEKVPALETIPVKIAISKPCIESAPADPVYRWGIGPLPATDKEKVAILLSDYEIARQHGVDWKAVAFGCVKSAAPTP